MKTLPKLLTKKSVISFVLIAVIAVGIPVTVKQIQKEQARRSRAGAVFPDYPPKETAISNIYSSGFTVSYVTQEPTVGKILYGPESTLISQKVEERTGSTLHHLTVSGLQPDSVYYFLICSGTDCDIGNQDIAYGLKEEGLPFDDENLMHAGVPIEVTTGSALDITQKPPTQVFGSVEQKGGTLPTALLVRARLEQRLNGDSSSVISSIFIFDYRVLGVQTNALSKVLADNDPSTKWILELHNTRNQQHIDWFNYNNSTRIFIDFYTKEGYQKSISSTVGEAKPLINVVIDELIFPSPTLTLPSGETQTLEARVDASSDDAEEDTSGSIDLSSSDLELVYDGGNQTVGMRFNNINIPQGASIVNAYIQFKVDETPSNETKLNIEGEASSNSLTFTNTSNNISSRPRTTSKASWSPLPWKTTGEAGVDQRTPNISSVIQEIIGRADWSSGNSLSIIITGSGERVAESYNGDRDGAPLLHVEYGSVSVTATVAPTVLQEPTLTPTPAPTVGPTSTPTPTPASARAEVFEVRVNTGSDDAEEDASGSIDLSSSDLELVYDKGNQTVGIRFNSITIPQGSSIVNAYIQFKVDETPSNETNLNLEGEATSNSLTFTSTSKNISSRPRTSAKVSWSPLPWGTTGEAGSNQRTPNISSIIQEIVSRFDWSTGNSLSIIVTGTGERVAESYNGDKSGAPLLHVEFLQI